MAYAALVSDSLTYYCRDLAAYEATYYALLVCAANGLPIVMAAHIRHCHFITIIPPPVTSALRRGGKLGPLLLFGSELLRTRAVAGHRASGLPQPEAKSPALDLSAAKVYLPTFPLKTRAMKALLLLWRLRSLSLTRLLRHWNFVQLGCAFPTGAPSQFSRHQLYREILEEEGNK